MAQWFRVYKMNDAIVALVVRTFGDVFPAMEIWETCKGDIIMLGSDQPWKSDAEVYQRLFSLDRPRADLASIGLTSPAMIQARQFASQRTASAIPGPGRIQTDDFPVLEYEAPKAFYIGQRSQGLCRFDERTFQSDLAAPQKKLLLAGLDEAGLKSIFGGRYESMDSDLQAYVSVLYEQPSVARFKCIGGGITLPCLFGANRRGPLEPPPAAQTNDTARQLFEAEAALQSAADPQLQAIGHIRDILNRTGNFRAEDACWSASYYAGIAAKTALCRGDTEDAKQILLRGLQLEPDSMKTQYIGRILERLGILSASDLPVPGPLREGAGTASSPDSQADR